MDFPHLRRIVAEAGTDPVAPSGPAIGRFILEGEIARGGMGIVYKAHDPTLHRTVAVKVIKEADGDPRHTVRLHREAAAAARLRHPNIVAVHDVGEDAGRHFIAMDFIDGGTLRQARLALRPAAEVLEQVARAVHHAHTQGIIHRDLKPDNILLDASRRPYVADFGLARMQGSTMSLTRSGGIMGTPLYMAPEQVRGEPAGPAADIYALGVILYELLADRVPYDNPNPEQLFYAILDGNPPPLIGADRDLATITLKAMALLADDRYATADALADDLHRWLAGEPIVARPLSTLAKLRRGLRKHRAVSILSACLALGIGVSLYFAGSAATARARVADAVHRLETMTAQAIDHYDWVTLAPPRALSAERAELEARIEPIQQLYRENPDAHELLLSVGRIYGKLGRFDRALTFMDDAIAKLGARAGGRAYFDRAKLRADMLIDPRFNPGMLLSVDGPERVESVAIAAAADLAEAERRGLDLPKEQVLYVKAIAAIVRQDGAKLVETLDKLLDGTTLSPLHADLLALMGAAYLFAGDRPRAQQAFDAAASIKRSDLHVLMGVAISRLHERPVPGRNGLAAATYARIVDPTCAPAWLIEGVLCLEMADHALLEGADPTKALDQARAALDAAIGLDADADALAERASLHVALACWRERRGEPAGPELASAIADADAALRLDALHPIARIIRSDAKRLGALCEDPRGIALLEEAADDATQVLVRRPTDTHALLSRGCARWKLANFRAATTGDPEPDWFHAIEDFDRVIDLRRGDADGHAWRGLALYRRGFHRGSHGVDPRDDLAGAEKAFSAALALEPNRVEDLINRSHVRRLLYQGPGDTALLEGARADLREAVRRAPGMAKAHVELADALLFDRELKAALAEYRRALELAPALEPTLRASIAECEK